jgi:hypothetical protein
MSCAKPMDNGVQVERGVAHLKAFLQDALRATRELLPTDRASPDLAVPAVGPRAAPASPGSDLTLGG